LDILRGRGGDVAQLLVAAIGDEAVHTLDNGFNELRYLADGLLKGRQEPFGHMLISFNGQVLVRKGAVLKMLGIGYGLPVLGVVHQVPEIGHHAQGHDDLVEMIEIIGRQQGLLVDIGARKARPDNSQFGIIV